MNTQIFYRYRDAGNNHIQNECVISGCLDEQQIDDIVSCLDGGEYFIPHLVGLPERKFDTYDPEMDHPFFELDKFGFSNTNQPATVQITAAELVTAFQNQKGRWYDGMEAIKAYQLPGFYTDERGAYGIILGNLYICCFVNSDTGLYNITVDGIDSIGDFSLNREWESCAEPAQAIKQMRHFVKKYASR